MRYDVLLYNGLPVTHLFICFVNIRRHFEFCLLKLFYQTYDLMQIVLPRAVLRMRVASYDVI